MQTILIQTDADWQEYRQQWNELAGGDPLLSFEWLHAWWNAYGDRHELAIVAVEEGGRLLATLPTYLHKLPWGREVRFLGSGNVCTDYLRVLVRAGGSDATAAGSRSSKEVIELLWERVDRQFMTGQTVGMRLEGVAADADWLEACISGWTLTTRPLEHTWRVALAPTSVQFAKQMKGKHCRRKWNKYDKRCEAGELSVRIVDSLDGATEALATMRSLHQLRRESIGERGCFADRRFATFFADAIEKLLAQQAAAIVFVEHDGQAVAAQTLLFGNGECRMYQSGMDPDYTRLEVGHAVTIATLRFAMARGCHTYDFLRGDEPYKAFWLAEPTRLLTLCIPAPTWHGRSAAWVEKRARGLRQTVRQIAGAVRLKPRSLQGVSR